MRVTHLFVAGMPITAFALLLGTPAFAEAKGKTCDVTVDRNYASGIYEVTRQELPNGDCICYIQTGPEPQSEGVEGRIVSLRKARSCADAVVMAVPAGQAAAPGVAAGASNFGLVAAGVAAAAGIGVAASSSSGGGPSSP